VEIHKDSRVVLRFRFFVSENEYLKEDRLPRCSWL
jgi:hypothetical protein